MTRSKPQAPADPLADLRTADDQASPALATPVGDPAPDPAGPADDAPEPLPGVVYDAAWHGDAIAQVVDRWHGDLIASRYAHKGGSCGCRYLARLALLEAVGMAEPDAQEEEASDA